MPQLNDLSKSLVALEQDATLIAVIEMSQSSWLVAGIVPGVERQPLKKLTTDQDALLQLLHRWRKEANEAGHVIKRIAQTRTQRNSVHLAIYINACRCALAHVTLQLRALSGDHPEGGPPFDQVAL